MKEVRGGKESSSLLGPGRTVSSGAFAFERFCWVTRRIGARSVSIALTMTIGLAVLNSTARADACYARSDGAAVQVEPTDEGPKDEAMRASFAEQLSTNQRTLSRCYQRALRRETDLSTGRKLIQYGIQVAADGKVKRVTVIKSDINDGMLLACLGETLCGFSLSATRIETKFSHSFNFEIKRSEPETMGDFRDQRKL